MAIRVFSMFRGSLAQLSATALLLLGLLGGTQAALAQASEAEQEAARQFIADLSDQAFDALRDESMTETQQRQRFRELLSEGVAIDYVGQILLGRFRREASEQQLQTYSEIFPDYIIRIYSSRIVEIGDERLEILGTVPQGRRDVLVRTQLIRTDGGPPIAADWRVRDRGPEQGFKIIDLRVEGISMAETKREEFASLISNNGFAGFLDILRGGSDGNNASASQGAGQ